MRTWRSHEVHGGGGSARRPGTREALLVAALMPILLLCPLAGAAQDEVVPAAPAADADFDYEALPLRVNVWQDKDANEVYQRGEEVRIRFETNMDAYAVVYRIDAEGEVVILWPRSRYDDGFVFGRHVYALPAGGVRTLRASQEEGVEYVEAIVSQYPFDLRELPVDFFHEPQDDRHDFYVTGDPFLAINEVNYAVTGLEDAADYVVTNYTSYYVHREVDHPRYLCSQCHDGDVDYEPYRDTCTVEIHYDYGWYNGWYVRYGYYPLFGYPAYYYVDPWTWRPWFNYWYVPVYGWPGPVVYRWPYDIYCWHDSPYWRADAWVHWRHGQRRFTPLSKVTGERFAQRDHFVHRRTAFYRGGEPTGKVTEAMRRKTVLADRGAVSVRGVQALGEGADRGRYRDVRPETRSRVAFKETLRVPSRTGLQVRSPRTGGADRTSPTVRTRPDRARDLTAPRKTSPVVRGQGRGSGPDRSGDRPTIRSVEPRGKGTRVWTGGRSSPTTDRRIRPGSGGDDAGRGRSAREPRRDDGGRRSGSREVRDRSGGAPDRASPSKSVKPSRPRSSGGSQVRPSSPSRSSSSGSESRGRSSNSSSGKSGSSGRSGGGSGKSGSSGRTRGGGKG